MKAHSILVILILFVNICVAQKIKVVNSSDLQTVEDVYIFSNNTSVVTDIRGEADIDKFNENDTLVFQHPSFKTIVIPYPQLEVLGFQIKMTETIIDINEIIISANRWQQNKNEVANRVVKITSDDIALYNAQTAADILEKSQSVFIQKNLMGGGRPMIRGFAGNQILTVIDGVRMNSAIYGSENQQNVISIDANSIESTEIIMGPGSVIYGSDAVGGVMNFQNINPQLSDYNSGFFANVLTRYASANKEKTAHIDFGLSSNKLGLLSSISYSNFDNLRMGTIKNDEYIQKYYAGRINGMDTMLVNSDKNLQLSTAYKRFNLMQKILYQPNDKWEFKYGFYYSGISEVSQYDRLIRKNGNELKYAEWFYGPQKWTMNSLSCTNSLKNKAFDKAKLQIAYQTYKESRNDRRFKEDWIRHRNEGVSMLSLNLDFNKLLNDSDELFYGLEYVHNLVSSSGNEQNINTGQIHPIATRYPDGSVHSSYAAYFSYKHKINDFVNLLVGGRFNKIVIDADFDQTYYPFPFKNIRKDNNAITPSVGLVYQPVPGWLFKLNGSVGYRSPNIDDIGKVFDAEPGKVLVPNEELGPEFAFNVDFGITKTIASKLQIDAVVFYTWIQNAIVQRDYPLNGRDSIPYDRELCKVQALTNTSSAYVFGFQTSINAELFRNFVFQSYFNYNTGNEFVMGMDEYMPMRHATPLFGSTHLIYRTNKLNIDFYSTYNSELSTKNLALIERDRPEIYAIDNEGNPYSPAWYTLNLRAIYQVNKHLQINAGVENMMDVRYCPYSSGIAAPGRNFVFSLRVKI